MLILSLLRGWASTCSPGAFHQYKAQDCLDASGPSTACPSIDSRQWFHPNPTHSLVRSSRATGSHSCQSQLSSSNRASASKVQQIMPLSFYTSVVRDLGPQFLIASAAGSSIRRNYVPAPVQRGPFPVLVSPILPWPTWPSAWRGQQGLPLTLGPTSTPFPSRLPAPATRSLSKSWRPWVLL